MARLLLLIAAVVTIPCFAPDAPTLQSRFAKLYPKLSDAERHALFQDLISHETQRIPELTAMWAWAEKHPDKQVYFAGSRLRALVRRIELQLDAGMSIADIKKGDPVSLSELSVDNPSLAKAPPGFVDTGDRDMFFLGVPDYAAKVELKKIVDKEVVSEADIAEGKRLGREPKADWDILDESFYRGTVSNGGVSFDDVLIGVPKKGPRGELIPNIVSPRGGIQDYWTGTLRVLPPDFSMKLPPGVGLNSKADPKDWTHIFPVTGLRYLRNRADSPWLKVDAAAEEEAKRRVREYRFSAESVLPGPKDLERIQKSVVRLQKSAKLDEAGMVALLRDFGYEPMLTNPAFAVYPKTYGEGTRVPLPLAFASHRPSTAAPGNCNGTATKFGASSSGH